MGQSAAGTAFVLIFLGTIHVMPRASHSIRPQRDEATQGATASVRPRITIDKAAHDFGVVGLGTEPDVVFIVKNAGAGVLQIDVPSVPAGLHVAQVDRTIAPSSSGIVRIAIDTFRAGITTDWRVGVTTNDPDRPSVELSIHADVRAFLAVMPSSARFTFVQYGREGGTTHVVSAVDEASFEVLDVESPVSFIRPTWRELKGDEREHDVPGRQWRIDLTIVSDAPVGSIGGYAVVKTTHKSQPRVFLPVSGFVRPLFAVTPPTVENLVATDDDQPAVTLLVKNFGEAPLAIVDASSDIAALDARVVPVQPGHVWRVEVRPAPTAAAGPFKGTLTLRTNHPMVREVTVPIQGTRSTDHTR